MLDETTMKILTRIQNLFKEPFHTFNLPQVGEPRDGCHSPHCYEHCINPPQLTFSKLIEGYQITLSLPETTRTSDSIKALAESKEKDPIYG
jgi:hypothetical protein